MWWRHLTTKRQSWTAHITKPSLSNDIKIIFTFKCLDSEVVSKSFMSFRNVKDKKETSNFPPRVAGRRPCPIILGTMTEESVSFLHLQIFQIQYTVSPLRALKISGNSLPTLSPITLEWANPTKFKSWIGTVHKIWKFPDSRARNMPVLGVYVPTFRKLYSFCDEIWR